MERSLQQEISLFRLQTSTLQGFRKRVTQLEQPNSLNNQLIEAAKKGNDDCVLDLLRQGAQIEAEDTLGYRALHWAACKGAFYTIPILLDNGARIEAETKEYETPLYLAIKSHRYATAQLLLARGANIEARTFPNRNTPLLQACYDSRFPLSYLLLTHGARIEARTNLLQSPLHLAIANNSYPLGLGHLILYNYPSL